VAPLPGPGSKRARTRPYLQDTRPGVGALGVPRLHHAFPRATHPIHVPTLRSGRRSGARMDGDECPLPLELIAFVPTRRPGLPRAPGRLG
jgi:hypothetical protein